MKLIRKLCKVWVILLSLPKSLYVCMRMLHIRKAIHIPVLVRYNVRLYSLSGRIELEGVPSFGMVRVGFSYTGIQDRVRDRCSLQISGTIHFGNNVQIGQGSHIVVGKNGRLSIGSHFANSCRMSVVCEEEVTIGNDVICSWDVLVMDTDYHETINLKTRAVSQSKGTVFIGNGVWLCTRSLVLKGAHIPDGCILAANSLANKHYSAQNTLLAGQPAKEKLDGVTVYRKQLETERKG